MQLFVRSAGVSVSQDYTWVNEAGSKVDIDSNILSCNVSEVKFVWKSTDNGILIFGNSFIDRNRRDLSNRPLRNYILLTGNREEAEQMLTCFANMLLDQGGFESMLSSSVQNTNDKSEVGFSVDSHAILAFLNACSMSFEARQVRWYLCEKDSLDARVELLSEICGALQKKRKFTALIGGALSGERLKELMPSRAVLSNVNEKTYYKPSDMGDNMETNIKVTVGAAAVILLFLLFVSRRKKS